MNLTFLGAAAQLSHIFACFLVTLTRYFILEIILKQLFALGLVNIGEYLPRLRFGEYLVNKLLQAAGHVLEDNARG